MTKTKTKTPTAVTVLREARKLILKHGNCKYQANDGKGRFCALGAVNRVTNNFSIPTSSNPLNNEARKYLANAIPGIPCKSHNADADFSNNTRSIIAYNDAPGTRKRQVVRLFERAIKEAK